MSFNYNAIPYFFSGVHLCSLYQSIATRCRNSEKTTLSQWGDLTGCLLKLPAPPDNDGVFSGKSGMS